MKKIDTLIEKLHKIADFVDRMGMSEDITLMNECLDLAYEIQDLQDPAIDIKIPEDATAALNKECQRILFATGLDKLSGGFCNFAVVDEYNNGWEVDFTYGLSDEDEYRHNMATMFLRKDTLETTTDEEEVGPHPSDD